MGKVVYQNDPGCLPVIQQVGCYFRACCHVAEREVGKFLSAEQLNSLWVDAQSLGIISKHNMMISPGKMMALAFKELGQIRKVHQIGIFKSGKFTFWGWVQKAFRNPKKYISAYIQEIEADSPSGSHYRDVSYKGDVLMDPWYPGVPVKSIVQSTLYYIGDVIQYVEPIRSVA